VLKLALIFKYSKSINWRTKIKPKVKKINSCQKQKIKKSKQDFLFEKISEKKNMDVNS